jgi:hypothetical protein
MQCVGAFCIALVVGWLTVLIASPLTLTRRAARLRMMGGILAAAAAGLLLLKLGGTTNQLLSAWSGLAAGLTGCAVMRYLARMHSAQ